MIKKKTLLSLIFLINSYLPILGQALIVYPTGSSMMEQLAAKEIRKYIYLRTDQLLEIKSMDALPVKGDLIVVAEKGTPAINMLKNQFNHSIKLESFVIKSLTETNRTILIISGGNAVSTLRAAYRFAEHLGIAFDLAGDIIPDAKINLLLGWSSCYIKLTF